jgi:Tfp pilus assembly protein PilX
MLERSTQPRRPSPLHRRAQGFVLVVALVLMAIMGVVSTAAIKLALQGDSVSIGLRSVNLTSQAAEIALRWCELQARLADAGNAGSLVAVQGVQGNGTQAPNLWQTVGNFENNAVTVSVPPAILNGAGLTNFPVMPRCLVEYDHSVFFDAGSGSTAQSRVYVSTVRAFSPDYTRQGANRVGSEVWLQSRLFLSY